MQAKLRQIADIIGQENLFADDASRVAYAASANFGGLPEPALPLACARPRHAAQISQLLAFCSREGIAAAFRGGGTAICGNARPHAPDTLIILTTGLNRILDLDAENRVMYAQPGVTIARIQAAAAEQGLFFPPEPYSAAAATIGGNIAMNAAGKSAAKYGPCANHVIAMDIFAANGEKLNCKTANFMPGSLAQGLPLANLFCGSMGALAMIGDAVLRLQPLPATAQSRLYRFPDGAAQAAAEIMAARLIPDSLEIFDPITAAILLGEDDCRDWLLDVEFRGGASATQDSMAQAAGICQKLGAMRETAAAERFRQAGSGLLPALAAKSRFRYATWSCPPARLPMLADGIKDICDRHKQKIAIFGHAGIAALHTALLEPGQETEAACREIFTLALMLNNAMTSERDAELTHSQWQARDAAIAAMSRRLRPLFDPAGILANSQLPGAALS